MLPAWPSYGNLLSNSLPRRRFLPPCRALAHQPLALAQKLTSFFGLR